MALERRDFLRLGCAACAAAASPLGLEGLARGEAASRRPARHWRALAENRVQCLLCPRECQVADRERGYCGVRENQGGRYFTLVHSRAASVRSDPIEKKPFFHYRPGTDAFSLATAGCNMECLFCQNWRISQFRPEQVETIELPPERAVGGARDARARSIAFTYNEPTVFFEYMHDMAVVARDAGLGRVMVSNGFVSRAPLDELCSVLDGVKIDLKAFTEGFYERLCHARLRPVLDTLRRVHERGVWLEIVVLVIPTHNDDETEVAAMARWIVQELGPDVPVHFTRFQPTYRLTNLPPTPVRTLERLRQVAMGQGVRYVYLGNVPGHEAESTSCHSCGSRVIEREGFYVRANRLVGGRCPRCHTAIPGVWS